ncbi:Transposase [Cordylochernes scorpioides]|uniref:Transposase n=1 Tax=Cordylochernes scorpioides TaxID=51811 RepID=A0ABY6KV90_9ARAC|nr:Transposase [Cordylochernes scorpioides]
MIIMACNTSTRDNNNNEESSNTEGDTVWVERSWNYAPADEIHLTAERYRRYINGIHIRRSSLQMCVPKVIVAVYACGVDVEKGPIRQQLWNAPPCDNVESWFWGAIAYDSRSPLLRIQGTMTAQRYVDDVLRPVTLPYLQGVPNALYQQDNARPHTARISQQALQDVQMLPWPPYSPDLSPIEHVWDIIGRRLHALPQPRSEDELWQMVEREWRAIPQDAIRTLIDSLPRRVAACIAVRGGPTCY